VSVLACGSLVRQLLSPKSVEGKIRNEGFYDPIRYHDWSYVTTARNPQEQESSGQQSPKQGPTARQTQTVVAGAEELMREGDSQPTSTVNPPIMHNAISDGNAEQHTSGDNLDTGEGYAQDVARVPLAATQGQSTTSQNPTASVWGLVLV
jgi:hypothetical protein